jgi:hypothetical protein
VETIGDHDNVDAALDAHAVDSAQRPAMLAALARLEASEVISAA